LERKEGNVISLLNTLGAYGPAINVLSTIILVVVTTVYVVLTGIIVRQNTALRKAYGRPMLAITVIPQEGHLNLFDLRIENVGGGPAHAIRLRMKQPFKFDKVTDLEQLASRRESLFSLPISGLNFS
jgi:hypothetical protein